MLTLYTGNKNYSSWSMRPWVLLKQAGITFEEKMVRFDGFDADYAGWGKEDSDLIVRLLHAGIVRKDGNFATGVIHLWHKEADRSALSENERKLAQLLNGRDVRAKRGLSALKVKPMPVSEGGAV